jgi:hypothetical protein
VRIHGSKVRDEERRQKIILPRCAWWGRNLYDV